MSAYKDNKTGNWVITLRYTDDEGNIKRRAKRGFKTKKEALAWETDFLSNKTNNIYVTLDEFYEVYLGDISNKIRNSTLQNKKGIYERFISPTLGKKELSNIEVPDILKWQNKILGQKFKDTYARSINSQLIAVMNHAERYYYLKNNPCKKVTCIGSKHSSNMDFWTKKEFDKFIKHVDDESEWIYFNILFYTGIRIGELLAIRLRDIDFDRGHLDINESAQYVNSSYIFTKPKTRKGERIVTLPDFLVNEIKTYVDRYYTIDLEEQVFVTNKSRLSRSLKDYSVLAGVKKIRIHDLRHSHASILIEQGIQPNMVQERLGHEKIETTLNTYSHLYPNKQYHLADFLNNLALSKTNEIINLDENAHDNLMIGTTK